MSIQSRLSDRTVFNAGIGTAIGVGTVLVGQGLWLAIAGRPDHNVFTGLLQSLIQLAPAAVQSSATKEAAAMGLPLAGATKAYWYAARAGGIIAYVLLWFAALWGIMMSSRLAKGLFVFGLHEFLPILAAVFATLHGLVLLGDQYIGFSLFNLVVPFAAPYRPLWTGLGQVAFYLSVALIASFYIKDRIGRRTWRLLHYATYLAFALALTHGLLAGTDSSLPVIHWMYIGSAAALLFATFFRILTLSGSRKSSQHNSSAATRTTLHREAMLAAVPAERRSSPSRNTK